VRVKKKARLVGEKVDKKKKISRRLVGAEEEEEKEKEEEEQEEEEEGVRTSKVGIIAEASLS
jgi:hypothetical protein